MLPPDFISYTSALFGATRWQQYLSAFNEPAPVSIRLNPFKQPASGSVCCCTAAVPVPVNVPVNSPVPWSRHAYYLSERPNFTLDPLLHAGAYYVQEASSMFLDHVLTSLQPSSSVIGDEPSNLLPLTSLQREALSPVQENKKLSELSELSSSSTFNFQLSTFNSPLVLDLSAAPGGKSTLLRAALPDSALLFSNEPDRHRANILMENMQKQGHPNVVVTCNYPRDYQRSGLLFDMILCDVPCSGEGMFRKDPKTISEWSVEAVLKCQQLQRSIVQDIWPCLKPGGILIYSTCTFNTRENEENIQWILDHLGAEVLSIPVPPEWHIQPSLLPGFHHPVYRFIPGITRGEGLFMCVLQKPGGETLASQVQENKKLSELSELSSSSTINRKPVNVPVPVPVNVPVPALRQGSGEPSSRIVNVPVNLTVLHSGRSLTPTVKGKKVIPPHAESLLITTPRDKYPRAELTLDDALSYLRHEAIQLPPDVPRGYVIVTYQGLPLGFVNNIGTRANNLYPKEWKIRMQGTK